MTARNAKQAVTKVSRAAARPGPTIRSVDQYIRSFPASTQEILRELRAVIREAAPGAEERISYGMPTYFQDGTLVHLAAYDGHVGLYGASSAIRAFERELREHMSGKGTLRFPLDRPIPIGLVRRIVKLRVDENSKK